MMEFEHEKFGKCELVKLTQLKAEEYAELMKGKSDCSLTKWRGDSVRACVKLKFLLKPEWSLDDVDEASPGHVLWISECITKWQTEALYLDPLSSSPQQTTQEAN